MKIKITKSFRDKLNNQIEYISKDKPIAARKFKNDILKLIEVIPKMPYIHRKSFFFDRTDIRDLKAMLLFIKLMNLMELLRFLDLQNMKELFNNSSNICLLIT